MRTHHLTSGVRFLPSWKFSHINFCSYLMNLPDHIRYLIRVISPRWRVIAR